MRTHATIFPKKCLTIHKAKNEPKTSGETGRDVKLAANMGAHGGIHAKLEVRPRLVQQSPKANPKLVEAARKFAEEVKAREGDAEYYVGMDQEPLPEAPLIVSEQQ